MKIKLEMSMTCDGEVLVTAASDLEKLAALPITHQRHQHVIQMFEKLCAAALTLEEGEDE